MPAVQRARRPWGAGSRRAEGKGRPPRQSPLSRLPSADRGVPGGGGGPRDLAGAWDPCLLLSPAGGSPAREGRGERGWIGAWKPGSGIKAPLSRFPVPLDTPSQGRTWRLLSLSPIREGPPGTCSAGCPFPGPFVPGKPDAPSAASPARCLFQLQLSGQLLSLHNGVMMRPPQFGSRELPLIPQVGLRMLEGCATLGRGKHASPGTASALVSGLAPAHPRASFAASSSGCLRLWTSQLFIGGSTPGVR